MQLKSTKLIRAVDWMRKHLMIAKDGHMTPEIRLRLLTPECPMWMAQPEQCPFNDPYWAFYWPGGQALTRFIFDNPQIVNGKKVLDFGAGCGASSVAAKLCGASNVTANDIDPVALLATALNGKLNGLSTNAIRLEVRNLITTPSSSDAEWDVILVGDCCYDSEFSSKLLTWLKQKLRRNSSEITTVVIGDPGRHALANLGPEFQLRKLHCYALPAHLSKEHYGLTAASIYQLL